MEETCSNCLCLILILSYLKLRSCFELIRTEFDLDGLTNDRFAENQSRKQFNSCKTNDIMGIRDMIKLLL